MSKGKEKLKNIFEQSLFSILEVYLNRRDVDGLRVFANKLIEINETDDKTKDYFNKYVNMLDDQKNSEDVVDLVNNFFNEGRE